MNNDTKTLYVGNLPFSLSSSNFNKIFEDNFGPVHSSKLIVDLQTGRPKGFGFVVLPEEKATPAIEALNGSKFEGRDLVVALAKNQ